MEDQIVAELGLREEQSMPAAGFFPLRCGEERREAGKPLPAATDKIVRGQLIGEFLQAFGVGATHKGVRRLPEADALLAHAVGEPMMLVEADLRRERQVGTHDALRCFADRIHKKWAS